MSVEVVDLVACLGVESSDLAVLARANAFEDEDGHLAARLGWYSYSRTWPAELRQVLWMSHLAYRVIVVP